MGKNHGIRKSVNRIALIGLLVMMTACGGGKKEDTPLDCNEDPVVFFFCTLAASSSLAPNQSPTSVSESMAPAAGIGETTKITQIDEYEPNNVLDNANVVTLPSGSPELTRGLVLNGSVQSIDDATDHFVFTPVRNGSHRIFLCADTCGEVFEDDTVYIMIYDQNQTTIASTPVGTTARQEIEAELTAGFAYYVEINGYNATGERYDYRLSIMD